MLEPAAEINLTTLAKALEERPELVLEISGAYDAKADLEGLRENALLRELGVDPTTGDRDDIALREMESTVERQTSPSEAAMIRGQYMADDGSVDEQGLREALWNQMLATQVASETDARALAPARAEAIRAFLVDQQGIESGRVTVLPEARTLDTGEPMVRCELGLSTG
jgi:hypothetical protein